MPRNTFLDFLKGVLILLVVTGHWLQHGIYHDDRFWSDPFFKWIYMFHMPLFMAVAGYLSQPGIDRAAPQRVIAAKFLNYVVPIIVWALGYCLAVCVLKRDFSAAAFARFPGYWLNQVAGDLWFLWALFLSVMVTAMSRWCGGFSVMAGLIAVPLIWLLPEYGNVPLFKFTYLFFQIGYLLARVGRGVDFGKAAKWLLPIALPGAVICYLCWNDQTYVYQSGMHLTAATLSQIALRHAGAILMSIVVLYASKAVHDRLAERWKGPWLVLGRDSIYIYILQNYFFMALALVKGRLPFIAISPLAMAGAALVLGALTCAGCYLAGSMIARQDELAAMLFGKRKKAR